MRMSRPPDDGGERRGRGGGRALSACPRGTRHSARARGSSGTAGHCPLESAGVRLRPAGLSLKPAMIMCSGQTGDRLSLVSRCRLQMCRTIGLGFRRRSSKPAVILRSRVGNGLQDLDGAGPAVRQPEGGFLAHPLAVNRSAQRRARRVGVNQRAAVLPGGEQERHLFVVPDEPNSNLHARADHAVGARRAADAGALQDVLQGDDPRLDLTLLVLGRMVAAVLTQIPFLPGRLDLLGDFGGSRAWEVVDFGREPVVRLLGQPGDAVSSRVSATGTPWCCKTC